MNQHTCHSWKNIHDDCLASVLTKEDVDGDILLANNGLGKKFFQSVENKKRLLLGKELSSKDLDCAFKPLLMPKIYSTSKFQPKGAKRWYKIVYIEQSVFC